MKNLLIYLIGIALYTPSISYAIDQKAIDACGLYKNLVLKVANQAEKDVPKHKVKEGLPSNFGEMVDFVYYFNGVKSKNEIVSNQLNECLEHYSK